MTILIRQIGRNVCSNYITLAVYAGVNFFLAGYLVRRIGADGFGLISLILSSSVMLEILINGVNQALTREVAASPKADPEKIRELFNTALGYFLLCGVAGASCLAITGGFFLLYFNIPPSLLKAGQQGMLLLALKVLLLFPFTAYQGVLWGLQRYDLANIAKMASQLFRAAAVVFAFEFYSPGIIVLIIAFSLSFLLERILWRYFVRQLRPEAVISIRHFSTPVLKSYLGFGSLMLIIHIANLIGYEAVKWLIGLNLSLTDVGGYTLIATLVGMAGALHRAVANVVMPLSSELEAKGEKERIKQLLLLSTKYSFVVSCGLCLVPLPFLHPLLQLWVGGSYPSGYLLRLSEAAQVLFIGQWLLSTSVCIQQMLTGKGRVGVPAVVTLGWAAGSFIILVIYFSVSESVSIWKIVWVLAAARALGAFAHLAYGLRLYALSPWRFFQKSLAGPSFAALIIAGTGWLMGRFFQHFEGIWMLSLSLIWGSAYLPMVWFCGLNNADRCFIRDGICYR